MLNEERVKLFAMMLDVLISGSPVSEKLREQGQNVNTEVLVRVIAEQVTYPQIDLAAPAVWLKPMPYPNHIVPNTVPYTPGYPGGTTICANGVRSTLPRESSMSQADGRGDDAGTRGD